MKRFIRKWATRRAASEDDALVRAFGKLPSSREFVHIEDGQGAARAFAEWVGAGHDAWVAAGADRDRGTLYAARLVVALPGHPQSLVVASLWPSRDQAEPPRQFPFTLYVLVKAPGPGPLACVLRAEPIWERFDEMFALLQRPDAGHPQKILLQRPMSLHAVDLAAAEGRHVAGATIPLPAWIAAVGGGQNSTQMMDWLWRLRHVAAAWRGEGGEDSPSPIAARCPLAAAYPLMPQVIAWLRWVESNVSVAAAHAGPPGADGPYSIILPARADAPGAAVSLLGRPLAAADFQLLTSRAPGYAGAEDLSSPTGVVRREGLDAFLERIERELPPASAQLGDWARARL